MNFNHPGRRRPLLPRRIEIIVEWVYENGLHLQWRDRAGFSPASLLCPWAPKAPIQFSKTAACVSNEPRPHVKQVFLEAGGREITCNARSPGSSVPHPTDKPIQRSVMTKIFSSFAIAGLIAAASSISVAADEDAAKAAEAPKAPSAAAVAAGKKIDWAKMDENAKKKYMKSTVLPTMKKLFVAFDKK